MNAVDVTAEDARAFRDAYDKAMETMPRMRDEQDRVDFEYLCTLAGLRAVAARWSHRPAAEMAPPTGP